MKKIFAAIILVVCTTSSHANEPAPAAGTINEVVPAKSEVLARGQQIVSGVCVACHGLNGMSAIPTNPNLAGMPPQYIAKQLEHFKSGIRKNVIMQGMAANLTPADMNALGEYFFAQKPAVNAVAKNKTLAERGQKIYRAGIAEVKVPACAGCHGGAGAGIPAIYPRLAGQWPDYTYLQLKSYASGERKHPIMNTIGARIADTDMQALAEYVAGMRAK
jgi:cytochrome c553